LKSAQRSLKAATANNSLAKSVKIQKSPVKTGLFQLIAQSKKNRICAFRFLGSLCALWKTGTL
jgi:hypothetical protein